MNGQAFANLHKIKVVDLRNNVCIDRFFVSGDMKERASARRDITKSCGFDESEFVEITCERFNYDLELEYCVMNKKTLINANNSVVAELTDEEVEGIDFNGNKNIEYLPYKVYKQFPNLVEYYAPSCSIKQIAKVNFEKLTRLKFIHLSDNKIQKIAANTFGGLESLNELNLGEINL